jgi:hypothetical protein
MSTEPEEPKRTVPEEESAPTEEAPKKRRRSRFADAAPAESTDFEAPTVAAPATSPLAAAQQALQNAGLAPAAPAAPAAGAAPNVAPAAGISVAEYFAKKAPDPPAEDTNKGNFKSRGAYEAAPLALPPEIPVDDGVITKIVTVPNEAVGERIAVVCTLRVDLNIYI